MGETVIIIYNEHGALSAVSSRRMMTDNRNGESLLVKHFA